VYVHDVTRDAWDDSDRFNFVMMEAIAGTSSPTDVRLVLNQCRPPIFPATDANIRVLWNERMAAFDDFLPPYQNNDLQNVPATVIDDVLSSDSNARVGLLEELQNPTIRLSTTTASTMVCEQMHVHISTLEKEIEVLKRQEHWWSRSDRLKNMTKEKETLKKERGKFF
jgi:hypothetical protein